MISPADADYIATKNIKKNPDILPEPFRSLVRALSAEFNVPVLNAIYEKLPSLTPPRLMVVLERDIDLQQFNAGLNFDPMKQLRVAAIFREIIATLHYATNYPDSIFVAFSSFERVARADAVGRITKKEFEIWKEKQGDPNLWLVSSFFESLTVFYFTEVQAETAGSSGKGELLSRSLTDLASQYDEFGYLAQLPIRVRIDSKERFDRDYKGNWFYYYR